MLGLRYVKVQVVCNVWPPSWNWLIPGEEVVGARQATVHVAVGKTETAAGGNCCVAIQYVDHPHETSTAFIFNPGTRLRLREVMWCVDRVVVRPSQVDCLFDAQIQMYDIARDQS